jgi:hypothetical protein
VIQQLFGFPSGGRDHKELVRQRVPGTFVSSAFMFESGSPENVMNLHSEQILCFMDSHAYFEILSSATGENLNENIILKVHLILLFVDSAAFVN